MGDNNDIDFLFGAPPKAATAKAPTSQQQQPATQPEARPSQVSQEPRDVVTPRKRDAVSMSQLYRDDFHNDCDQDSIMPTQVCLKHTLPEVVRVICFALCTLYVAFLLGLSKPAEPGELPCLRCETCKSANSVRGHVSAFPGC